MRYKDIFAKYPASASSDWHNVNGARYSYNGLATMRSKAALGKQYGGIMLWELAGDTNSTSAQSLLRAIDSSVRQAIRGRSVQGSMRSASSVPGPVERRSSPFGHTPNQEAPRGEAAGA